ncbi:DUF2914 domain-containing protein [Geobacter pickeringii]|uniref:DUF2914 domain-containing protein n=1 Tax=Geobacter pickeringii TaxID=345632 RepID=A0A0B5BDP2_9BACT|nr:DUF2914 domain-containing protein [Geobacter pickeringii]AJE04823.1 hypothetical protein GPICK_05440 [Geobacter pickeringii]
MGRLRAFLVVLALLVSGATAVSAADIRITEMAVTTKIVRNNPIDSVKRISSTSVKALYCFTRLVNPSGEESVIKHVWYQNGEVVGEQELSVKGEKWRTWSKKPIDRESVGKWRVEALDSGGKLLKAVEFKIN